MNKNLFSVHPGEVLLEEFLKPMGIRQNHLAIKIGAPARGSTRFVLGKRRITADTALRLARYFGTTVRFRVGLQTDYDLDVAAVEGGRANWTRGHGLLKCKVALYVEKIKLFQRWQGFSVLKSAILSESI